MFKFIGLVPLFFSCTLLESSLPDGEELEVEAIEEIVETNPTFPVNYKQWACCASLCHGRKRIKSVASESGTPYINCECRNGKKFRVTRKIK